jgi:hypothetical protein
MVAVCVHFSRLKPAMRLAATRIGAEH